MTKIAQFFLIFISLFLQDTNENTVNNIPPQKPLVVENVAIPLFAVTGFSSEQDSISMDSLKTLYCSGNVYVLKATDSLANLFFDCKNSKQVENLRAFIPLAKKNILVTDIKNMSNQFKALKIDGKSFFEDFKDYPLIVKNDSSKAFDYSSNITKFSLTGVTAITRNSGIAADTYGIDFLTENLKPHFENTDILHISNEVSFSEGCYYKVYDPNFKFCTKKEHFQALLDLGADVIELTGNHNLDYGQTPYKQTFQWYKDQGMKTFGGGLNSEEANTPIIVKMKDGKTLGFIGFNESCPIGECADQNKAGANRYEREKARKVIQKLRNELKADYIIATVQFNEVDSYAPTTTQDKISKDLLEFGADMVYGSQAHQVQQVEFHKGKSIFHGLGNFLFDQVHRIGVRQAFFLHNYFYEGKYIQSVPVFTFIAMNRKPMLATKEEIAEMKKVVYLDSKLYK